MKTKSNPSPTHTLKFYNFIHTILQQVTKCYNNSMKTPFMRRVFQTHVDPPLVLAVETLVCSSRFSSLKFACFHLRAALLRSCWSCCPSETRHEVLVFLCYVWILVNCCKFWKNISIFVFAYPKHTVSEVLWFLKMQLCKP